MYNGEDVNTIIIRNKNGEIIAELDLDNLTCNNSKFQVTPSQDGYEDVIEIRLCQKTYK